MSKFSFKASYDLCTVVVAFESRGKATRLVLWMSTYPTFLCFVVDEPVQAADCLKKLG